MNVTSHVLIKGTIILPSNRNTLDSVILISCENTKIGEDLEGLRLSKKLKKCRESCSRCHL